VNPPNPEVPPSAAEAETLITNMPGRISFESSPMRPGRVLSTGRTSFLSFRSTSDPFVTRSTLTAGSGRERRPPDTFRSRSAIGPLRNGLLRAVNLKRS
jgi:hypothetical protein